jgi:hypothetical protein
VGSAFLPPFKCTLDADAVVADSRTPAATMAATMSDRRIITASRLWDPLGGERPPSLSAQSAPPREVLHRDSQATINHQVLSELEAAHIAGRTATETPDDVWSIDAEVSAEPRQTPTSRRQPQLGRHDCRQTPTKASHRRNRVDGHTHSPAPLIH